MSRTAAMLGYRAFGCMVASEVPLPELLPVHGEPEAAPDIVIRVADLTGLWLRMEAREGFYNVRDHSVIFRVPDVATFCVQEGRIILISPASGSDWNEIRLYILGTCMGALLLQRKVLPLHGSAVAVHGRAYAFIGESGAGKSTLASAFLQCGYPLVSDDIIAVSLGPDHRTPIVTPSYPQQKLWQESIDRFGWEASRYRPLYGRETKFSIPVMNNYASTDLPLAGIYELATTERGEIEIRRYSRLESLPVLYRHTFRNMLVHRLGLMEWHLGMTATIANQGSMHRLQRPVDDFTAPALVSHILNTIHKDG